MTAVKWVPWLAATKVDRWAAVKVDCSAVEWAGH